jgi:RHS repeat-associated protein
MDGCGRVVGVTLVKEIGRIEGRVGAVWERGTSLDRLVRVDGEGVSHLFEYDEKDCAFRHVLKGNLTGMGDVNEEYETLFRFDESCRPVEIRDQNGRLRLLKYPDEVDGFFVAVDKGVNTTVRQATIADEMAFEQIEDDGCSTDIKDLSGITWRRWKRVFVDDAYGEIHQTTTVGAFDPVVKKDVVLRRECCLLSPAGEVLKTEVFDREGALVSRMPVRQDGCWDGPMSLDEIREFVSGLRNTIPSLVEPLGRAAEMREDPVSVMYTSRGQMAHVVYRDGTHEECKYFLDGGVCHKVYRDGHKVAAQRDCRGHLLSSSRWEVGASVPSVVRYSYNGPYVASWSTDDDITCRLDRDCFGRVTVIEVEVQGNKESYALTYDALDRLIQAEVCGHETWSYARQYSLDGDEVTVVLTKDGISTGVREVYTPGGAVLLRDEEVAPGQSFRYAYDGNGRVTRIDHCTSAGCHLVIEKQYEVTNDGALFQETSKFPDLTTQIEERDSSGRLVRRVWKRSDGTVALEEKIIPLDTRGSACVQRMAGDEERAVEWKVGDTTHLESVGGIVFKYDVFGNCIWKRSPDGREVYYEWNAKGQMTRQYSSDETIDYRFSYDNSGRICRAHDAITCHTVVRSFDTSGHLIADGESASYVRGIYDAYGALVRLDLPGGVSLRYDGKLVYRDGGEGSWSVDFDKRGTSNISKASLCCTSSEMEFHDPLGSWKERFRYDAVHQLQGEEGEFQLSYGFDAFGMSKVAEDCRKDGDGNVIELGGAIIEYDALGRLSRVTNGDDEECYRYDGFGRLQEIIQKNGVSKKLCWLGGYDLGAVRKGSLTELKVPHPVAWRPVAIEVNGTPYRVESDARGSIVAVYKLSSGSLCEVYRYSAFGNLHIYGPTLNDKKDEAISPWLYCGKRLLKGTYDFGARRYSVPLMRWLERDPLGFVDTADDRVYVRNNPQAFSDPTGLFSWLIDWSEIESSVVHAVQCIGASAYKTITFAKQPLDWLLEFRSIYEEVLFQLLGQTWLRCSGYNLDSSSSYVCGVEEKNPKVRITLINGILNGAPEAKKSAELLFATHGDIPVHFVYAATEGFLGDMLRCALAKAGIASPQAKMLANVWRQLIDEMGGIEGGGTIFHYAHSLGATETLNALQLLNPEERNLIRIATFGAPTLLDDGVCAKVDNYVSKNDGVPIIDYRRYFDGANGIRKNVHFIPSDAALPLVDHHFGGKTYRGVLEILGQKFQEKFLLRV